jgi:DNA-binding NarL/FixJ family response regulator
MKSAPRKKAAAPGPVRILIVDDDATLRHGIKDMLASRFRRTVFGEAGTVQAALQQIWEHTWDLMVLDVTTPGRSALKILKRVTSIRRNLPVLVWSANSRDPLAVSLLQAGAAGYITKLKTSRELLPAIEQILAGGKYFSFDFAESPPGLLPSGAGLPPSGRLSSRESLVMRLIASGKAMKEIAAELSLAPQTVSTCRSRMLKKLALRNNAQLIRYALDHKLAD